MNDDVTANPGTGSDSAQPSTALDNPANWDYDEPEDEANDVEQDAGTETERETDEGEPLEAEAQETEGPEQDDDDETDDDEADKGKSPPGEVTIPDDATVTLENGEKVKFGDLRKAPLLQRDYSNKMHEVGNQRRELVEANNRITSIVETFTTFLANQLPEAPQPSLALQNPGEYTQKKAMYDAALAQIQSLIEIGTQGNGVGGELDQGAVRQRQIEANDRLLEALPDLRDPKRRDEFNKRSWEVARYAGFSPEELGGNTDHRLLIIGDLAFDGLKWREAKANVAKKVDKAPTATPVKRAAQKGNPQFLRNKEAMRRLDKTGSIHDAMSIDFE